MICTPTKKNAETEENSSVLIDSCSLANETCQINLSDTGAEKKKKKKRKKKNQANRDIIGVPLLPQNRSKWFEECDRPPVLMTLNSHSDEVLCVVRNASSQVIASGSIDKSVRLWDSRASFRSVSSLVSFDSVTHLCFNPSNEHLLWCSSANHLLCFDLRMFHQQNRPNSINFFKDYECANDEINFVSVQKTGEYISACDDSGCIFVVNCENGTVKRVFSKPHTNIINCVRFFPNKQQELISGGFDSTIVHWDIDKAKPPFSFVFKPDSDNVKQIANPPFVYSLDFSYDNKYLAVGLGSGDVSVFLINDLRRRKEFVCQHLAAVTLVQFPAFEPRSHLLTTGNDRKVLLFDVEKPIVQQSDSETFIHEQNAIMKFFHPHKPNWIESDLQSHIFVCDHSPSITVYSPPL